MTSHSRAIRPQTQKIVKFVKFGPLIFLNCESTCDFTDIPASILIEKRTPELFTLLTLLTVLYTLFSKTEMRQFGASENLRI